MRYREIVQHIRSFFLAPALPLLASALVLSACEEVEFFRNQQSVLNSSELTLGFETLNQSVSEGNLSISVPVVLSRVHEKDLLIEYKLSGTAKNPNDHDLNSGTLLIPAGEVKQFITFNIFEDALTESDKTIRIVLSTQDSAVTVDEIYKRHTILLEDDDAPAQLVFVVQPSDVALGTNISPSIQVGIQNADGALLTNLSSAITLSIQDNTGAATLGGTLIRNAVAGLATFNNISLNAVGVDYTLSASIAGGISKESDPFDVSVGSASQLAFFVQPSNTAQFAAINPAVVVEIQDSSGTRVSSATNSITLSLGADPSSGSATFGGTLTVSAVAGRATFTNLTLNEVYNAYRISASSAGLTAALSNAFNISANIATQLSFTVEPTNTAATQNINPAIQVSVLDALGNLVSTANHAITLAFSTDPSAGTASLSGTLTVAAVSGVAQFSGISINKVGNAYRLSASTAGLTADISNSFNITAGAATQLAFAVEPVNTAATASITPSIQVTVQDAGGNTVTSSSANITLAFDNDASSGAATLSGTLTRAASSGVATFNNISINKVGTGYTLAATSAGLSGDTSAAFNITTGAATQLAFTVEPVNTAATVSISPSIQVTVQDAGGNTVTSSSANITLAFDNDASSGAATLSGTLTRAASSGVATFNNISINKVGTGYTLAVTSAGLSGDTSAAFNITTGAATQLAFTVEPVNTAATVSISPSIQVTVQDAGGNTVTSSSANITLAFDNDASSGAATLSGTLTRAASSGVATFNNISINKVGTGYTLAATSAGLSSDTSASFNIVAGSPTQLAYFIQPASAVSLVAISPAVQVEIQDAGGNRVSSASENITLAIENNASSGSPVLGGTLTAATVLGVATFSNITIDLAGTGYTLSANGGGYTEAISNAFNITHASASKLAFSQNLSNTVAGVAVSPAIAVTVQDASGNTVTSSSANITLAFDNDASVGTATLSGTLTRAASSGLATFNDISINVAANNYTLAASSAGLTGVTSSSFNITAAAASKLAYVVQPTNEASMTNISPTIEVGVYDQYNNLVRSSTASITLAISTDPSGGTATLFGTKTQSASVGVASFNDIQIDKAFVGYTLVATATGLTSVISSAFRINVGTKAKLAFTVQPSNVIATANISPDVKVAIQDAGGNTVTSATDAITLQFGTDASGGTATLSGTTARAAVSGVSTFNNININVAATGYTLSASAAGLTSAVSSTFNVTVGAAAQLAFTVQPSSTTSMTNISPSIQVTLQDAGGNTVTAPATPITLSIQNDPSSGATLSGTLTRSTSSGVATFNNIKIDKVGTGYTLLASGGSFTKISSSFNISVGAPAQLVFGVEPSDSVSEAVISPTFTVQILDAGANLVSTATNTVVIAFATDPSAGAAALSGTVSKAAVAGVASFNNISIDIAAVGYTLTASSGALTTDESLAFDISHGPEASMAWTIQPTDLRVGDVMSPSPTVTIYDNAGNITTSTNDNVTIGVSGGLDVIVNGTLTQAAVNGVAVFDDIGLDSIGTYSFDADNSDSGLAIATSDSFEVSHGDAHHLVYTRQPPAQTASGSVLSPSIRVAVVDIAGNPVLDYADTVEISAQSAGFTLGGTLSVSTTAGIANFSNLTVEEKGTWKLQADSGTLPSLLSNNFNIICGAVTTLAFTAQPSDVNRLDDIAPAIKVRVYDANGNFCDNNSTSSIELSIDTDPAGSTTLAGATTDILNAGEAVFSDINLNKAGVGFKLLATFDGSISVVSNVFTVQRISGDANLFAGNDGTLDGFVLSSNGASSGRFVATAISADGEYAYGLGTELASTSWRVVSWYVGTGLVNNNFNGGSELIIDDLADGEPFDITVDPSGNLILAGSCLGVDSGTIDMCVMKMDSSGIADGAFGVDGNGIFRFSVALDGEGSAIDIAKAVTTDIDGNIYLAGCAQCDEPGSRFAIAKVLADGALDKFYGTNGITEIVGFSKYSNVVPGAITLSSDISVYVAVEDGSEDAGSDNWGILKLDAAGKADKGGEFAALNGRMAYVPNNIDTSSPWSITDIAYDTTSDTFVTLGWGLNQSNGSVDTVLVSFNPDGTPYDSFGDGSGGSGEFYTQIDTSTAGGVVTDGADYGLRMLMQEGKSRIVVAGHYQGSSTQDMMLLAIASDGTGFDSLFTSDGMVFGLNNVSGGAAVDDIPVGINYSDNYQDYVVGSGKGSSIEGKWAISFIKF